LVLDGGEPTLYPALDRIIHAALETGYKEINIITNGVVLADKKKVAKLLNAHAKAGQKLTFCVSLHSHRREISECLTNSKGTFHKTVRGIKNLLAAGFYVSIYHVITRLNYRELAAFADFVRTEFKGVGVVHFSHIYPTPGLLRNIVIYPRLSEVPARFNRARDILKRAGITPLVTNCGIIPWCLMKGIEKLFLKSVRTNRGALTYDTAKQDVMPFLREIFKSDGKVKNKECGRCALDIICGGIWDFYARLYGTDELSAFDRDFFRRIPGKKRAVITAGLDGAHEICLRIFDARLKGCSDIELRGFRRGPGKRFSAVKDFAREIGFSKIVAKK